MVCVVAEKILIGTCSWTDQTLVKDTDWYPKKSMTAAERLKFYAERFPLAEADSTYYFPPSPQLTRGWAERTPHDFTMNVKAYSLLTGHPAKPNSLWPDLREAVKPEFAGKRNVYLSHLPSDAADDVWRRFRYSLRPMIEAGKLGAVLMQYPEWFTAKKDNRAELAAIPGAVGGPAGLRRIPLAHMAQVPTGPGANRGSAARAPSGLGGRGRPNLVGAADRRRGDHAGVGRGPLPRAQ